MNVKVAYGNRISLSMCQEWTAIMKKGKRKNPHALALGTLGGLVRSEAKRRADRDNGRKGGLVKSRKKKMAARRNARRSRPGRRKKSSIL
jgi:hypothetical protein